MTDVTATQGSSADRFGQWFSRVVLISSVVLLLAGIAGFSYLRINSPLALLNGSDRPIAAASALVPARSPFTFSLLTEPERLRALQRALVRPANQALARSEAEQIQQRFEQMTGLSYERDIQSWLGQEITFAYTDRDLDLDRKNGQQPGYLTIFEIAPGRYEQAKSFLQLFWQRQALAGNMPEYQTISGVKILSSQDNQPASLTAASALVGRQFVMFANDARILRSSIHSAQTAQNLAQSPAYRQQVAALPDQRIGLAYLDTRLLGEGVPSTSELSTAGLSASKLIESDVRSHKQAPSNLVAISLEVKREGLMAIAHVPTAEVVKARSNSFSLQANPPWDSELVGYLPANSDLAVTGRDISELAAWTNAGLPGDWLPKFMRLQPSFRENSFTENSSMKNSSMELSKRLSNGWSGEGYALSRVSFGRSPDWILAVPREAEQIAALDQAAISAGYSVVPVTMDAEGEATAWTRFTARGGKRPSARSSRSDGLSSSSPNGLDSDLLGLHIQQGNVEIFASSLIAMDSALESRLASQGYASDGALSEDALSEDALSGISLSASPQFIRATAPLADTNSGGYVYINWPVVAPVVGEIFPILNQIQTVASPLTDHIEMIAASRDGETVRCFIPLAD